MLNFYTPAFLAIFAMSVLASPAASQEVEFTSSNLPIILLNTGGEVIPDEPKIAAWMSIIDNGQGMRNEVTDPPNDYEGYIGIELRGTSSQEFPKKQYGVETRDAEGENINVSLLGFPEENDWVLYAPYNDKSLMRNVLAYQLSRQMGHYASRTRFCEVVLNGEYQGVYVLMEKIKRDDNRVDINKLKSDETSGDDLTGGYLLQIDRPVPGDGWFSPYPPPYASDRRVFYEYREPDADDIVPEQETYIRDFIGAFEEAMDSEAYEDPVVGYPAFIDLDSFVDFIIVNELGKNVDGYRLSTYLHKDKDSIDGMLHAGPVWDFNVAFGNASYYGGDSSEGYQYDFAFADDLFVMAFWWSKLATSSGFQEALAERWTTLRAGALHEDSLMQMIDETATLLDEAQTRNFERWPILGEYVWPNAFVGETYAEEVNYLKEWLSARLTWLDADFSTVAFEPGAQAVHATLTAPYPNPVRGQARLVLTVAQSQHVSVEAFDVQGRRVAQLYDGLLAGGDAHPITFAAGELSTGVYFIRAHGASFAESERVLVLAH